MKKYKEVEEYYYNTDNIDTYLERLKALRATLDRNIQMLQAPKAPLVRGKRSAVGGSE